MSFHSHGCSVDLATNFTLKIRGLYSYQDIFNLLLLIVCTGINSHLFQKSGEGMVDGHQLLQLLLSVGRSILLFFSRSRSWLFRNRIGHIRPLPSGSPPKLVFLVIFWILTTKGPPPLKDKGATAQNIRILDDFPILHLTYFTAWKRQRNIKI